MTTPAADQGLLMNVAYRLLGSAFEAEDAVQEAYARWYAVPEADRAEVASPTAWLVTTVSRICLDVLGSARARRERYVGEWLPEPISTAARWTSQSAPDADPAERASLDESLSMALLVVLETMTPAERVAFVLHDVFGYRFAEIAGIVGRSPDACRQLASSARRRVRGRRRRRPVPGREHARAVSAFRQAWTAGDLTALIAQLDPGVTAVTDGGGRVSAALAPVHGAEPVARLLLDVPARLPGLVVETARVNAAPGLVARSPTGQVLAVISAEVRDARVARLWVMRNPAKLTTWRTLAGQAV